MKFSVVRSRIQKYLGDEAFLNNAAIGILTLIGILSAYITVHRPTLFSFTLVLACAFLITRTYLQNKVYRAAAGINVADAMIPSEAVINLGHSTTVSKAISIIGKSYQQIFPVFYNENLLGIVERQKFIAALGRDSGESYISDYVIKKFEYVYAEEALQKVLANGSLRRAKSLVVFDKSGNFCGLIDYEKLIEYLLIDKVFKESKGKEVHDEFWL